MGPFTPDPRKAMKALHQARGTITFAFPWLFVQIIRREGLQVGGENRKGRIPSNFPLANYFSFNALCSPFSKNKSLLRFCGFCLAPKQLVPKALHFITSDHISEIQPLEIACLRNAP